MILTLAAMAALSLPAAAQPAWTWTLYEGEGPVVLAEEVPDTPQLRNTIECDPGSGVARVTLYRADAGTSGFVTVTAQDATTQTQAEGSTAGGQPRLTLPIRMDHPVFSAFRARGGLTVRAASGNWTLEAPPALVRRFGELCAG